MERRLSGATSGTGEHLLSKSSSHYNKNLSLQFGRQAEQGRRFSLGNGSGADCFDGDGGGAPGGPRVCLLDEACEHGPGSGGGGRGSTNDNTDHDDDNNSNNNNNSNNRTTDSQTMMHILKANIGTGVLAMPLAFKNVGLWLGLCLVPVIGAVCIHCMNILISSHNRLCDRFNFESLDYDQVAALGLACGPKWARRMSKKAHIVVTTFLMFTQIGFCCVYTLFTVENLQVAMLNLFSLDYSTTTYLVAVFPVIGLTSCTSNLKHLARISTLANCLQLFGLSLILFDLLQFHTYWADSLADDQLANSVGLEQTIVVELGAASSLLSGLPLFFATAVYAFEGIGVVLPLIKEMQRPERISGWNGVLNTAMSMVAVLYMAIGFFGYAKYGQTVAGSITLNLPGTTINELVRLAFALAIGLSYSLQFYVPWTIVWPLIDESLFYSYRPRVPRDKLDILQKLNKDNHWAITGKAIEEHQKEQAQRRQQQQAQLARLQDEATDKSGASAASMSVRTCTESPPDDQNSLASTLATSYSMSTSYMWHQSSHLLASKSVGGRRVVPVASGSDVSPAAATSCDPSAPIGPYQYGSIEGSDKQALLPTLHRPLAGNLAALKRRRLRNRLEDVAEREGPRSQDAEDEEDSMPDVQWRPPPSSMRGKRKLVRYTVILLTVSFTFVAAALIPRLDLFISLIGALASSSLAIIFPAIIQLCTFWNYNEEDQCELELASAKDQATLELERERRRKSLQTLEAKQMGLETGRKLRKGRNWTRVRQLKWLLFVAKNCFLVVFGFLGLITGSWVSLAQLGVAGVEV